MTVLHTIDSLSLTTGGTASSTRELLRGLNAGGVTARVLTLHSPHEHIPEDSFMLSMPDDSISPLRISLRMRRALLHSHAQLFHTHGLWRDTNHATCRIARQRGIPCVISLHGMLYPTALAHSGGFKRLMMRLGHQRDLSHCSCIHVTSRRELKHLRALGISTPAALIPLPIAIPDYLPQLGRPSGSIFRVGFLGRIHPIKNIESLIRSWATLQLPSAELLIIGRGDRAYENSLRQLVLDTQAPNVRFIDFVQGRAKYELLASLDILCAPSLQENFGMSIAEALLAGTPVIATQNTPWQLLRDMECGQWIQASDEALTDSIWTLYRLPSAERNAMGQRGAAVIRRHFSSTAVCQQMRQLYHHLITGVSKPEFMYE